MSKHSHGTTDKSKEVVLDPTATNTNIDPVVEPATEKPEVISEPTTTDPDPVVEPDIKKGIVVGCSRLNIRSEPFPTGEILFSLPKDTKVSIYEEASTDEFYRIGYDTETEGFAGFGMKKYISLVD